MKLGVHSISEVRVGSRWQLVNMLRFPSEPERLNKNFWVTSLHEKHVRFTERRGSEGGLLFTHDDFLRRMIPYDEDRNLMTQISAILGNLKSGEVVTEVHRLLVKLEI